MAVMSLQESDSKDDDVGDENKKWEVVRVETGHGSGAVNPQLNPFQPLEDHLTTFSYRFPPILYHGHRRGGESLSFLSRQIFVLHIVDQLVFAGIFTAGKRRHRRNPADKR